jgi:TonB family protein
LHYNGIALDDLSRYNSMPSYRRDLTIGEQYFQGVLSAAFTLQEYNEQAISLDKQVLLKLTPSRMPVEVAVTAAQENDHAGKNRAFDKSTLDEPEAESQWISVKAGDFTPGSLTPEGPDPTVRPIQVAARDNSSSIDAATDIPCDSSIETSAGSTRSLDSVPDHLLREFVEQALQMTHATGALIALGQQGEMICRAVAGDSASEIGARIEAGSDSRSVIVYPGKTQPLSSSELSSRADAEAHQKPGANAVMVVPLLREDRLLGLIKVFSRRPFAFGVCDLQMLQDLAGSFAANLQLSTDSTGAVHESSGIAAALDPLPVEKNDPRLTRMWLFGVCISAVIACLLCFYSLWKLTDPVRTLAKGQVTLLSTILTEPAPSSRSQVMEGTLLRRVDPTYPLQALQRRIQGQVLLQVRINKDGFVYGATAIRGEPILSQAAVEAARQWRYSPYRRKNKPIDVAGQITFEFSLLK